jgi:6-pyruvoyltetrahydropterin/6-carboxytetrahydropterin synthase
MLQSSAISLKLLNFASLYIMPVFYLTRKEHFNAAHKLYNPAWTKERNDEVFGKCANENWHGHNFELLVTVRVVDVLDHRNLNLDVPFMAGKICSIENLVWGIWHELLPHMPAGVALHCIRLVETPRIFVEYFGE